MGIFDFFKTEEEKEEDEVTKIFKRITERKKEINEAADELISSSDDNLVTNGQISTGVGRFGLDVTNPIPVKGFSGLDNYFNKLNIKRKLIGHLLGSEAHPLKILMEVLIFITSLQQMEVA